MKHIRWISMGAVAGGVMLLSGCVAVPGSYGYDNGYNGYYSQPSYYEPAPVVAPSVYIQGGTYYDRGYYNRGYYDGRPGPGYGRPPRYDGPRDGGRPQAAGPAPRPGPPPRAATTPQPQQLSPSQANNVRNGFTPDGRQRE